MGGVSRRRLLAGGLGLGAAAALGGCDVLRMPGGGGAPGSGQAGAPGDGPTGSATTTSDDDGSWTDTGPQPHQPTPEKLGPGDTPPQFVVISWDGAGESPRLPLLSHFRGVAQELNASMTLFLSGIYTVPKDKRTLYHPPGREPGASAIPFFPADSVHATIDNIGKAWLEGHEIGTHFNGHFCGDGGVGSWTPEQWKARSTRPSRSCMTWRTNTGFTDLPPLPFDYRKELVGGRTPCLEGSDEPAASPRTSSAGATTPARPAPRSGRARPARCGPADLQSIPFAGPHSFECSRWTTTSCTTSRRPRTAPPRSATSGSRRPRDTYVAGFKRAYDGNRAPLIIGNHFEDWNGGIYMKAVEAAMRKMATYPDTRFVSFRQLCDYLDAQDPATLTRLRKLPIGSAPSKGWASFLTA